MKLIFIGGLIAPLIFSISTFSASKITGFILFSCGKTKCVTIKAPEAGVGTLDGNYGLGSNEITISDKSTNQKQRILSQHAYVDFLSNRLYIREIKQGPTPVALYDFQSEELLYFPK